MKKRISISLLCLSIFTLVKAQTIDTLIDVGGHKLHFHIINSSGTPILFEAGNGDDGSIWQPILSDVYKATGATLLTYDRAGLGKSGFDSSRTGLLNEIKDLELALKKLKYSKNIFIVCHSFGGFYAALFTHRNIKKVKGVVAIDIVTPCFFTKDWTEAFIKTLSKDELESIKKDKPGWYYSIINLPTNSVYMQDKFFTSKTPLTMIRAENIMDIIHENEKQKWIDCCKALGTMANHTYVVAKNADHHVWQKDPQVVIDEVSKLYKQVERE
jgi:pimeloyl-ACP methyl ester carboxylesterase